VEELLLYKVLHLVTS